MAENPVSVMKRFRISEKYGFVMEDPLDSLPEYFAKWDKLSKNCAELLSTKKLREEVNKLELLDVKQLDGYRQHRLAYMYLSYLANGYVWQEGIQGAPKILPKQIAIPLCFLADYLGTKPAFTYSSLSLWNYKLVDKDRCPDIGNLQTICQFLGGEEFEWFAKTTIMLEIACAPAIKAMLELIRAVDESLEVNIVANLKTMTETLVAFKEISSRYHEKTTGHGFFHVFRPFFVGWGGTGSAIPDGLIYDGVNDNHPIKVYGANASQSSTIPCFDAALGMEYEKDTQDFLDSLLEYMPKDHREFVLYLRKNSKLKYYVKEAGEEIRKAYDECVAALRNFRSYHIQLVTKYVYMQLKDEREGEALKTSAGAPLMQFLKDMRDTTQS